ncbi:transglutaminase [Clostridiaceae bacterium 14S0207]|nr:transglutaminase [Clostridiaceae bacterium 14S0207]
MIKDPISIILVIAFFYPILKGFLLTYRSIDQKRTIYSISSTISFLLSIYLGIFIFKGIFMKRNLQIFKKIYELIPRNITEFLQGNFIVLYLVVLPLIIFIIYMIIKWIIITINSIILYPIFDGIESISKKRSKGFKRVLGAIFELPRSIVYVIIICFILNYGSALSIGGISQELNKYIARSQLYNRLSREVVTPITNSNIAKKLPNIINESFKIEIQELKPGDKIPNSNKNVIVYYNGITLNDAIKSNTNIDEFSKRLVSNKSNSYEKSKTIYRWISSNIKYDYNKAKRVLNNDFSVKSGSVNTFNTRQGICFDYSSLFVSMCRANDIKVRLVTGKGFDGTSWVSHAWNQVYIQEKNKWINVDTTFGVAGDYFNTSMFSLEHKESNIAGEW